MVDFNGFDKGVIGKKLPSDTTLNNMRKADLIELLHIAEHNHRVLAETYKIAVDTSKCKSCPLSLNGEESYQQGRADGYSQAETDYHKQTEKDRQSAFACGYEKGREDAIEEVKTLIQSRLVESLCLENATKYGNKNAEQQVNSYAKVMKYDIADCVDDLLDDLEQLKEKKE